MNFINLFKPNISFKTKQRELKANFICSRPHRQTQFRPIHNILTPINNQAGTNNSAPNKLLLIEADNNICSWCDNKGKYVVYDEDFCDSCSGVELNTKNNLQFSKISVFCSVCNGTGKVAYCRQKKCARCEFKAKF